MTTKKTFNRRNFLKGSLLSAAAASFPARSWAQIAGSSDTVRAAVVGFRSRGGDHIKGISALREKKVRIVALCDVDSDVLQGGIDSFRKRNEVIDGFVDIRRVLDRNDIDVITIATPNHWHALGAIWAVQAGKDVYLEKPVSHNVWEGRKIVEAARKYKRIVQTGTQIRSSTAIKEAIEWVKAGHLGKITVARGLCYKPRGSIGNTDGEQPIPASIDYNLWCGPAPLAPLRRQRLHYDWHWLWDYGNGDLGNQGIHQMDIARWFLGEMELSPGVLSVGGRLGYEDDGETPNTQIVYHDYSKAPLVFEVRGLPQKKGSRDMDKFPDAETGGSVAVVIHCEGGYVVVPTYSSAIAYDKDKKVIQRWKGDSDHYENFIAAVRSRKHTDLNADILEGHLSSALCHTGNISYRLGSGTAPEEIRERIKDYRDLSATFGRMQAHLEANGVDLTQTKTILGMPLKMDPQTEKFIGQTEANALLVRHYRRPFVVPEQV